MLIAEMLSLLFLNGLIRLDERSLLMVFIAAVRVFLFLKHSNIYRGIISIDSPSWIVEIIKPKIFSCHRFAYTKEGKRMKKRILLTA